MASDKFTLARPVNPWGVNQEFGEDPKTYARFKIKGHNGLDLRAKRNQPIYAAHDGIAYYQTDSDQGHGVVIISDTAYLYKGEPVYFKTIYWHMVDPEKDAKYASPIFKELGKANLNRGIRVKRGDLIGYANNTGYSNGDHVHFGLKPILPIKSVAKKSFIVEKIGIDNWYNVEQDNGYKGSIDPTPYLPVDPLPPGTSVPLKTAIQLLMKAGLPQKVLLMALQILNVKYNKNG